jgi:hypothetical protein
LLISKTHAPRFLSFRSLLSSKTFSSLTLRRLFLPLKGIGATRGVLTLAFRRFAFTLDLVTLLFFLLVSSCG